MKLETKYNVGDKVFSMRNNRAEEGVIRRISIVIEKDEVFVYYQASNQEYKITENCFFSSKQELLDSL